MNYTAENVGKTANTNITYTYVSLWLLSYFFVFSLEVMLLSIFPATSVEFYWGKTLKFNNSLRMYSEKNPVIVHVIESYLYAIQRCILHVM